MLDALSPSDRGVLVNCRRARGQAVLVFTILFSLIGIPAASKTYGSQAQSKRTKRPFRMLVLGDSVMWGQGLEDEHKFSYKIREWICAQRNGGSCQNKDDVQIHVEAHSGAVIAQPSGDESKKEEERFTRIDAPVKYPGEVNHKYPSVWGQVDLARRYYEANSIPPSEVDLIFVNGGINDMGAPKILLPFFGGSVTDFARKYCEADMKLLLEKVASTFPNARIVVPGYFPLVSINTPDNIVAETIGYLFLGKKEKANEKGAIEKASTKPADEVAPKPSNWLRNLAKRSQQWADASNNAFQAAVKSFNSGGSALPLVGKKIPAPPPTASMRALFVVIPFRNENAYAAKEAFLWKLIPRPPDVEIECAGKDSLKKLIASDELQTKRPCMCDQVGKGDDLICLWAGAFHPNVQGADLYFRSITKELERILPFTGWVPR
jgi:lysophospholipase L1-like esterase